MKWLSEYLLSVTAAAMICMIAKSLIPQKSTAGHMIRVVTGVILVICVFFPLRNIRFRGLVNYWDKFKTNADTYVSEGAESAQISMNRIITEETAAYILNAAEEYGLSVDVAVELKETSPPELARIVLSGMASPYKGKLFLDYIYKNLGLTEEQVVWN